MIHIHSLAEGSSHVDASLSIGIELRFSLSFASQLIVIITAVGRCILLNQRIVLALIDSRFDKVVILRRVEASTALLSSLLGGWDLVGLDCT